MLMLLVHGPYLSSKHLGYFISKPFHLLLPSLEFTIITIRISNFLRNGNQVLLSLDFSHSSIVHSTSMLNEYEQNIRIKYNIHCYSHQIHIHLYINLKYTLHPHIHLAQVYKPLQNTYSIKIWYFPKIHSKTCLIPNRGH